MFAGLLGGAALAAFGLASIPAAAQIKNLELNSTR
jgi:hypothetical protein